MPAPDEVTDALVEQARQQHEELVEQTMLVVGAMWAVLGGLSDRESAEWAAESLPVVRALAERAATMGDAYGATLAALELDVAIAAPDMDLGPNWARVAGRNQAWDEIAEQIESHARSPLVKARWKVSEGVDAFEALGESANQAARLAAGDVERAYRAGVTHGATKQGGKVSRWLKVPGPSACNWCVTVAARGYRSAESVPRHGGGAPPDRCGVRPVMVRDRSGVGRVRNEDWYEALRDEGFGSLVGATSADMVSVLAEVEGILESADVDLFALIGA